jgi:hypothetical protein
VVEQTTPDRRWTKMKRWLWLFVLGALAAILVACQSGPATVNTADDVQRIGPEEAKALLDAGDAVLYDTRSRDAFRSQRAAGAVSFPEEEVPTLLDTLPDENKALIFYCT